ncbi:MAG: ATP-binding protein [bacterium]
MATRSSSFDSLPKQIQEQISESADCLVKAMKIPGCRMLGVDFNVASFLPDLFAIYSTRCSESGLPHEPSQNAPAFARSLEAFATQAMHRGFFLRFVPSRQVVVRAYDGFCVSGESFFDGGQTSGGPRVQSFIRLLAQRNLEQSKQPREPSLPPEDWGQEVRSQPTNGLLLDISAAIESFRGAASVPLHGEDVREHARRTEELFLEHSQRSTVADSIMLGSYLNGRTLAAYQSMMANFERWFLIDLAGQIEHVVARSREAAFRREPQVIEEMAAVLLGKLDAGVLVLDQLRRSTLHLEALLDSCKQGNARLSSSEVWDALNAQLVGFCHAYRNIIAELALIGQRLKVDGTDSKRALEYFDELPSIRISRFDSVILLVRRLFKDRTEENRIDFQVGNIPSIEIPESLRLDVFKAVEEIARNAVKYHDSNKPQSKIWLEARMEPSQLLIRVIDNGLGIRRIEKALAGGWREHPDMAPGSGRGLQSAAALAIKMGGTLNIFSREGKWTRAELRLPTSGWESAGNDSREPASDPPPPDAQQDESVGCVDSMVPDISLFPFAFGGFVSR